MPPAPPTDLFPKFRHPELIKSRAASSEVLPRSWSWSWFWFCTADMSASELPSLEECLETHLPEAELSHVRRILFGKETR